MFDFLAMIEPYVVGLGLVFWEIFIGWCIWASVRTEIGFDRGQPVSDGHVEPVHRARSSGHRSRRSWRSHVPATSA